MPAESSPATEPLDDYADSPTYRWVIRSLYVTAIGLNIWILWKASADDTEVAILRARVAEWWRQLRRPALEARDWRKATNRLHYAAERALEAPSFTMGKEPDA